MIKQLHKESSEYYSKITHKLLADLILKYKYFIIGYNYSYNFMVF